MDEGTEVPTADSSREGELDEAGARVMSFFVPGVPAPQGSKRHVGRGILVESSKRLHPWRNDVAVAAMKARGAMPPLAEPVALYLAFYLPRPKGHLGRSGLRPGAPMYPGTRPDLDKLARAVCDALTGICWLDDSQVVSLWATKGYSVEAPGVTVTITPRDR